MSTRLQVVVDVDACDFTVSRGPRGVEVSSVTVTFHPVGGFLEPLGVGGSGREYTEDDELGSRRLVSLAWEELPGSVKSQAYADAIAAVLEVHPA